MWRAAILLAVISLAPRSLVAQPQEPVGIALDANGSTAATLYPGWPLVVQVAIFGLEDAPLALETAGPWAASVRLTVLTGAGTPASWPWRLPQTAPTSFKLGWMERIGAAWLLSPEATQALPAGEYRLSAELDTTRTAAAGGWRGVAQSRSIVVRVAAAPPRLSAEEQLQQALAESRYAAFADDPDRALGILEAYRARNPGSDAGLSQEADILEEAGRYPEALAVVNRLIQAFGAVHTERDHPPLELLERRSALQGRLAREGSVLPTEPAPIESLRLRQPAAPPGPAPGPAPPQKGGSAPAGPQERPPAEKPAPTAPAKPSSPAPTPAPAPPPPPTKPAPQPAPAAPADDAKARALKDYQDTVAKGDALYAAGDHFEAVLAYERAWRVRYNNKLDVPAAELDERLAKARKARDEKKKR